MSSRPSYSASCSGVNVRRGVLKGFKSDLAAHFFRGGINRCPRVKVYVEVKNEERRGRKSRVRIIVGHGLLFLLLFLALVLDLDLDLRSASCLRFSRMKCGGGLLG